MCRLHRHVHQSTLYAKMTHTHICVYIQTSIHKICLPTYTLYQNMRSCKSNTVTLYSISIFAPQLLTCLSTVNVMTDLQVTDTALQCAAYLLILLILVLALRITVLTLENYCNKSLIHRYRLKLEQLRRPASDFIFIF